MLSNKEFNLPEERNLIRKMLRNMPDIKAKPGFDQRMAARFAMELDKEVQQRNISWLKKSKRIKLPDVIS